MSLTIENKALIAEFERFERKRLPILKGLKVKLDSDVLLNELELLFIKQVFEEANRLISVPNVSLDFQAACLQAINIFKEISKTMDMSNQ